MSTKKQHHTLYGLDQSSQPPRNSPLLFAQADTAPGCIRCPACRPLNSDVRPKRVSGQGMWILFWVRWDP